MSRTIRYKLSEEEFRVVLEAASGLGISVDELAKQCLAYTLSRARELQHVTTADGVGSGNTAETGPDTTEPGTTSTTSME